MKSKKTINTVVEEIIANGIGWVAGLLSIDLLKLFFIERKFTNAWGLFSKKTAVSGATFSFMEWTLTAIIGFAVMIIVNSYIRKKLFKKVAQIVRKPESASSDIGEYQEDAVIRTAEFGEGENLKIVE
ncbi:MAG: hypothetical protein P1P88_01415 [Bacteroidales bacterium]|nr:hypothetical protein [Bacteroidales bacterium]